MFVKCGTWLIFTGSGKRRDHKHMWVCLVGEYANSSDGALKQPKLSMWLQPILQSTISTLGPPFKIYFRIPLIGRSCWTAQLIDKHLAKQCW